MDSVEDGVEGHVRGPRHAFEPTRRCGPVAGSKSTAWVTGGGRGIGAKTALALAEDDHDVAVSARTEKQLQATAQACQEEGVEALAVPCDVTRPDEVQQAYRSVREELGAPGVLVNNAGLARGIPFLDTSEEDMQRYWEVNVMGAFRCTKRALPAMLEEGWGRVVNVASVAGKVGAPYTAAYAVSKHGMLGLTRSVAQEFPDRGVTVNAVCPGYVNTEMTRQNVERIAETTGMSLDEARQRLQKMSPQERFITADEVAAQILNLCQESSRGIHGQALTIDGGKVQW